MQPIADLDRYKIFGAEIGMIIRRPTNQPLIQALLRRHQAAVAAVAELAAWCWAANRLGGGEIPQELCGLDVPWDR